MWHGLLDNYVSISNSIDNQNSNVNLISFSHTKFLTHLKKILIGLEYMTEPRAGTKILFIDMLV